MILRVRKVKSTWYGFAHNGAFSDTCSTFLFYMVSLRSPPPRAPNSPCHDCAPLPLKRNETSSARMGVP